MRTGLAAMLGASLAILSPAAAQTSAAPPLAQAGEEVFYHIFLRSFRDADGDRQGDLKGLTEKLPYLRQLGVTSILLTPLQPSPFYHNYFATDFRAIDPAYGTMEEYFAFVRAAHANGLKIYLDQEFQYVAEGHPWLTQARGRPDSPFSDFVLWNRPGNVEPEPFLSLPAWRGFDGRQIGIAMVDMRQPKVKRYFHDFMLFWIDPHGDGSLRDGIDGYRIDHMMDDLDHKGRLTNLFDDFWQPIFAAVRQRNPQARIVAEQADWGYGEDWLTRGRTDLVFAFPLRGAMIDLDKAKIVKALRETQAHTPQGKGQIVFLENHDTDRFASVVGSDPAKLRAGAAISLLVQGEPLLYYGQELGMTGKANEALQSDAAHIPLREAFRWQADPEAPGAAIWYKSGQPVWTARYNGAGGVSLEAQQGDPASLYGWYRRLLALRAARPELRGGSQTILCDGSAGMLCVLREKDGAKTLLAVNLGNAPERLPGDAANALGAHARDLLGNSAADLAAVTIAPMETRLFGSD